MTIMVVYIIYTVIKPANLLPNLVLYHDMARL